MYSPTLDDLEKLIDKISKPTTNPVLDKMLKYEKEKAMKQILDIKEKQ